MDYKKIDSEISKWFSAYKNFCVNDEYFYFKKEEKATEEEIKLVEKEIGLKLENKLRDFFLHYTKKLSFSVYFKDEFYKTLKKDFTGLFSATLTINLNDMKDLFFLAKEIKENCFDEGDKNADIYSDKLPFIFVPNGDLISICLKTDKIIYLSHEIDYSHGMILAQSFNDFLEKYIKTGLLGPEDDQMINFIPIKNKGLDPECENALKFRNLIFKDI